MSLPSRRSKYFETTQQTINFVEQDRFELEKLLQHSPADYKTQICTESSWNENKEMCLIFWTIETKGDASLTVGSLSLLQIYVDRK